MKPDVAFAPNGLQADGDRGLGRKQWARQGPRRGHVACAAQRPRDLPIRPAMLARP